MSRKDMLYGSEDVALFVEPMSRHYLSDGLFAPDDHRLNANNALAPYIHLKEELNRGGIPVHTADLLRDGVAVRSRNLYVSFGMRDHYRELADRSDVILSAFFAVECPVVEPSLYAELSEVQRHFKRVYSWSDSVSLYRFTGGPLNLERFRWPQSFDRVHPDIWSWDDREFLVMINSNKLPRLYDQELYTERLRAVAYFARRGEIDLYGHGWDGPPYRVGRTRWPNPAVRLTRTVLRAVDHLRPDPLLQAARSVYRGPVLSKAETLGRYTFAICFENMILRGWITEKIFDCFHAGAVPIYWGAPDIQEYVPRECFIDMREFEDYSDLAEHLKSLGSEEIRRYRVNARDYLESEAFRPFTKEAFVEMFIRMIEEDAQLELAPA